MTLRTFVTLTAIALLSACSRQPSKVAENAASAAPPVVPAPVEAIARAARPAPPVLFVGLGGVDWELLDDYIGRGAMPNLAMLVRQGTSGVLETDLPSVVPLVWTTMMTGKSPLEHGIMDFVQFNTQTGAKEPIASSARRVPALWNMATDAGRKISVIGFWATFPAEPVNGVLVSDRWFSFLSSDAAPSAGVVFPPDRERWVRDALIRAEQSVDFSTLHGYLPSLTEAEYRQHLAAPDPYAHPISALRRILVEGRAQDELGRATLEQDHPDVTALYLGGVDSISQVFAPYVSPRQAGIPAEDYERYGRVPEQYFRAIDGRLGEYRALVERTHAVLMLASDGASSWRTTQPETPSGNADAATPKGHRAPGMYLIWGAGIPVGHDKHGSVQQVCATLLALAGLPRGQGLPGSPLSGTPVAAPAAPANYQAFYHATPAPAAAASAAGGAVDALAKLRSLGYVADSSSATDGAGETRTADSYANEGVILRNERKPAEATAAFEKALAADPNLVSALWNLSDLLGGKPETAERSDALLVRAYGNGLPEGAQILIRRAVGYQRAGQAERGLKLITVALGAKPDARELWLFRGRSRVESRDCKGAAADFRRAEALAPSDPAAYVSEGLAQQCAGDREAARRALSRSLELDPNQPKVRAALKSLDRN